VKKKMEKKSVWDGDSGEGFGVKGVQVPASVFRKGV
jgi:hypothetical protein